MISWTKLLFGEGRISAASKKPVIVWNITPFCNLNCSHCYFDSSKEHYLFADCVSEEKAKAIILDLSNFKIPVILFSGGEPLLRKDIFRLASFARKNKIKTVLSTNGTLITSLMARKIKESGFEYVGISIDGKEETHDYLRGEKGAFRLAVRGIESCQKEGIRVGLRFTLLKGNFRDLEFIFDFAEEKKIKRLCIYHLVYSGRGKINMTSDLSHEEREDILELIFEKVHYFHRKKIDIEILTVSNSADGVWLYLKLKKTNPERAEFIKGLLEANGGNGSGASIAAIDYKEEVFCDQFFRTHSLGNVGNKGFSEIWNDDKNPFLFKLRNRRLFIKGRCKRCRFFSLCNGNMRARALAYFGDPWRDDPACYLKEEEIIENERIYSEISCS